MSECKMPMGDDVVIKGEVVQIRWFVTFITLCSSKHGQRAHSWV